MMWLSFKILFRMESGMKKDQEWKKGGYCRSLGGLDQVLVAEVVKSVGFCIVPILQGGN